MVVVRSDNEEKLVYDKDLQRLRNGFLALVGLNGVIAVECIISKNWFTAFASVFWGVSCLLFRVSMNLHQRTRDTLKYITALRNTLQKMREQDDK